MGVFGYWLLASGYWQLNDRMKLLSFSVSCQKLEARCSCCHKLLYYGAVYLLFLVFMHVLGMAGVNNGYSVTIDSICKIPLVCIRHKVTLPSGNCRLST